MWQTEREMNIERETRETKFCQLAALTVAASLLVSAFWRKILSEYFTRQLKFFRVHQADQFQGNTLHAKKLLTEVFWWQYECVPQVEVCVKRGRQVRCPRAVRCCNERSWVRFLKSRSVTACQKVASLAQQTSTANLNRLKMIVIVRGEVYLKLSQNWVGIYGSLLLFIRQKPEEHSAHQRLMIPHFHRIHNEALIKCHTRKGQA